jgi:hypothetical protein
MEAQFFLEERDRKKAGSNAARYKSIEGALFSVHDRQPEAPAAAAGPKARAGETHPIGRAASVRPCVAHEAGVQRRQNRGAFASLALWNE